MAGQESSKSLVNRMRTIAKRGKWPLLGAGIGIGCAALLAAALVLLYGGGAKATDMKITGGAVHGERLTLAVTVENGGWFRANYHGRLTADGSAACARDIVLKPKEKRSLQMEVAGLPPGAHTLALGDMVQEVRVLRPASFRVTGLTVGPDTIRPGESVEAEATVENTGEVAGEYTAVFRLDGARTVVLKETIEPGASRKIKATLEQIPRGRHTVELDGASKPVAALAPASCRVSNLTLSAPYADLNQQVNAIVSVTNDGDYPGTFTAELFLNGKSLGTQEVSVEANGFATCLYELSSAKAGAYTVKAGELERTLKVVKLSRPKTGTVLVKKANGGVCYMTIQNGYADRDVIVTLVNSKQPKTPVLVVYVRAGEKTGKIKVKNGTYIQYYTFGTNMDAATRRFMDNPSYGKFDEAMTMSSYKTYSYPTPWTIRTTTHYRAYELTFGVQGAGGVGSVSGHPILESDYPD